MRRYVWLVWALVSVHVYAQEKEEFKLVKQDGTTSVYERWITFPKSDPPVKAREVKGEFFFNNTIYEGLRLLQDEERIMSWQNHVSEFKVYKQPDTTVWFEYSYHDIMWPVSDQDHFLVYRILDSKPNSLFITFESVVDDNLAPVRDDADRMKLSGSWTLEQVTPGRAKATYRILSMPSNIPKFLTDPVIRSNIMTTIKGYIALLEERKKK